MPRRGLSENRRAPAGGRGLLVRVLRTVPLYPRARKRDEAWQVLERLGRTDPGKLHMLLNDSAAPDLSGTVLRDAFERSGWLGIQKHVLGAALSHGLNSREGTFYQAAMWESLLFAHYGFLVKRCEYGAHWYVTGDPRRLECPDHASAGQQKRFWAYHRRTRKSK